MWGVVGLWRGMSALRRANFSLHLKIERSFQSMPRPGLYQERALTSGLIAWGNQIYI